MVREDITTPMEMFMREILKLECLMGKGSIFRREVLNTWVSGIEAGDMAMVRSDGLTGLSSKANSNEARSTAKALFNLLMVQGMLGILRIIKCRGMDCMSGRTNDVIGGE